MKLEEGMYARTNEGYIGKITWCCCTNEKCNIWAFSLDTVEQTLFSDSSLTKEPSFNPIDLIGVGDYVNGVEVIDKEFDNFNEEYLQCGVGDYVICTYEVKDIKTIVTKELFNAIKYEVSK